MSLEKVTISSTENIFGLQKRLKKVWQWKHYKLLNIHFESRILLFRRKLSFIKNMMLTLHSECTLQVQTLIFCTIKCGSSSISDGYMIRFIVFSC